MKGKELNDEAWESGSTRAFLGPSTGPSHQHGLAPFPSKLESSLGLSCPVVVSARVLGCKPFTQRNNLLEEKQEVHRTIGNWRADSAKRA